MGWDCSCTTFSRFSKMTAYAAACQDIKRLDLLLFKYQSTRFIWHCFKQRTLKLYSVRTTWRYNILYKFTIMYYIIIIVIIVYHLDMYLTVVVVRPYFVVLQLLVIVVSAAVVTVVSADKSANKRATPPYSKSTYDYVFQIWIHFNCRTCSYFILNMYLFSRPSRTLSAMTSTMLHLTTILATRRQPMAKWRADLIEWNYPTDVHPSP